MDGFIGQLFTFVVAIAIAFGVSYLISFLLSKVNRKLIFALPILLVGIAVVFWVLGLVADGWGALGFLLMGVFALIGSLGSLLSSLVLWRKTKPTSDDIY